MKYIKTKTSDRTLILTINREDKLNALNTEIIKEIDEALSSSINDNSISCIIITGSGNKSFVAGADISEMIKFDNSQAANYSKDGINLFNKIETSPKPVIAAVNGYALGGGCEIALACHLRYASSNAIFGQPEVKLGIIAGWGGTQNLPRLIGPSNALDLLLSGRNIKSDEAYRLGLVNNIFEQDLLDEVIKIAFKINQNSPYAISKTIASIKNGYNKEINKALDIEALLFKDIYLNF